MGNNVNIAKRYGDMYTQNYPVCSETEEIVYNAIYWKKIKVGKIYF